MNQAGPDYLFKEVMEDNRRYAEFYNVLVFHRNLIDPDRLHELDTEARIKSKTGKHGKNSRDLDKRAEIENGKVVLQLRLSMEGAYDRDYGITARQFAYAGSDYNKQMKETIAEEREKKFTMRYPKEAYLEPVIPAVMYFGKEEWDGKTRMSEMFNEEIREVVIELTGDYRVAIIDVRRLEIGEIKELKTDLREFMEFLKYSDDAEKLKEIVDTNERYRAMDPDMAELINRVSGSRIKLKRYTGKDGTVDMCKAVDDLRNEGRKEGLKEGIEKGVKKGRKEGEKEGRKEERNSLMLAMQEMGLEENVIRRVIEISDSRNKKMQVAIAS